MTLFNINDVKAYRYMIDRPKPRTISFLSVVSSNKADSETRVIKLLGLLPELSEYLRYKYYDKQSL